MENNASEWATQREKYTVVAAIIIAIISFTAIVIACFFKDMPIAEKITSILITFVGTPLGYLFGYSTTKSAEVSAKDDVAALKTQIAVISGAIESFKSGQQMDEQIISDLKLALEKEKALNRSVGDKGH